jgi:metallo-beta-lactamase family protein
MDGISGHADQKLLLEWLGNLKERPEKVFVNHGEDVVCDEFAQIIWEELGFQAEAPYNGAVYDLLNDQCIEVGNTTKIHKEETKRTEKITAVFGNLLQAAKRLMGIIEKSSGLANKDIKKFTAEIERLCDKWEN